MKIRTDFVTNSSSSSFLVVSVSGTKFLEIINKYKDLMETMPENFDMDLTLNADEFSIEEEEGVISVPRTKRDVVESLVEWFSDALEGLEDEERVNHFLQELESNKKEIVETLTNVNIEYKSVGWGGDSELRMNRNYTNKEIRYYLGLDEDIPITTEEKQRMIEYAGDCTSTLYETYTYDGKESHYNENFELE